MYVRAVIKLLPFGFILFFFTYICYRINLQRVRINNKIILIFKKAVCGNEVRLFQLRARKALSS